MFLQWNSLYAPSPPLLAHTLLTVTNGARTITGGLDAGPTNMVEALRLLIIHVEKF